MGPLTYAAGVSFFAGLMAGEPALDAVEFGVGMCAVASLKALYSQWRGDPVAEHLNQRVLDGVLVSAAALFGGLAGCLARDALNLVIDCAC